MWIVGLDLRPAGEGPARFARWLLTGRFPHPAGDAVYVHVLEDEHVRFALRQNHLDEVTAVARTTAERLLASAGAPGEIRVVQGRTADEALEEVRATLLVAASRHLSRRRADRPGERRDRARRDVGDPCAGGAAAGGARVHGGAGALGPLPVACYR